jgi:hypothetical protein
MGATGPVLAPPPAQSSRVAPPVAARAGAPASPARARLNLFQRTLLRWRELRPYNAAHALRVAAPLERARLQALVNRHLGAMHLTGLSLDPDRGSLQRQAGAADDLELRVLARREDPLAALWEEVEAQLNTPFPRAGALNAFRFFAVPADGGFYLGLVYDHFIAAGDAIAWLLRSIVTDYAADGGPVARATPPQLGAPAYRRLLLRHPLRVLWAMLRLPRLVARARRAVRPPREAGSPDTALAYLSLGRDEVDALRGAASAWEVTLNDLLLAGLLQALAPLAPERARARRRRELAVASIVSIRHELPTEASAAAGPFLASFHVSHPVPPDISLRELAQAVHAESARIKRERLYLQTLATLGASALMWPFLSPGQREGFFSKYHPVWGGVSMLNINALWTQAQGGPPVPAEYFRTVSTGPACPLVLTVTAAQDVLQIVVSFRGDVFSRTTVEVLIERLRRAVAGLPDGTHG